MGADSSFLSSVYRVGQVVFQGQGWGWVRSVYFALLLILAIVIVPLILIKLRSAWLEKADCAGDPAAVVPRLHHRHDHLSDGLSDPGRVAAGRYRPPGTP